MCSIFGALIFTETIRGQSILDRVMRDSQQRGRDGRGWVFYKERQKEELRSSERAHPFFNMFEPLRAEPGVMIGNTRAEPTTEYVQDKSTLDQQPYEQGDWAIVHNGTIANDKELRTGKHPTRIDSAAIVELLDSFGSASDSADATWQFGECVRLLKGSYAILAINRRFPERIYTAANYRPIWYVSTDEGIFFASARSYFHEGTVPEMLEPYSIAFFDFAGKKIIKKRPATGTKALIVCSGGLDSTVAATHASTVYSEIELLHFCYGSRAEGPEVKAVQAIGEALGCKTTLFPLNIYSPEDSPLLRSDSSIAGGEEGAEFAHEWVPARNLVMLSVATSYAEAKGFDTIILGNNLEEAGAYPDNEPEFIRRFNDLLPFAVADGKRVQVEMPVGDLMKHEIVALGHDLGAPMDKCWSCYRAGNLHCGTCGPCFMRRTAFKINNLPEVIEYEK